MHSSEFREIAKMICAARAGCVVYGQYVMWMNTSNDVVVCFVSHVSGYYGVFRLRFDCDPPRGFRIGASRRLALGLPPDRIVTYAYRALEMTFARSEIALAVAWAAGPAPDGADVIIPGQGSNRWSEAAWSEIKDQRPGC